MRLDLLRHDIESDMENFNETLGALSPVLRWLIMKKDSDLPWVTRLARWTAYVLGTIFAAGYVAHCFMEWFS